MDADDEWPESLPDQVGRLRRSVAVRLGRSRRYWAPVAWFLVCLASLRLPSAVLSITLTAPSIQYALGYFFSVSFGFYTGASMSCPLLAALAPFRLSKRLGLGLAMTSLVAFTSGFYMPWMQFGFTAIGFTFVFAVTSWVRARHGIRFRHRRIREPDAERLTISLAEVFALTAASAVVLAVIQALGKKFPTDPTIVDAFAQIELWQLGFAVVWYFANWLAFAPTLFAVFVPARPRIARRRMALAAMFYATVSMVMSFAITITSFPAMPWSNLVMMLPQEVVKAIGVLAAAASLAWVLRWSGYRLSLGSAACAAGLAVKTPAAPPMP